jgi:hypothetical protein
MNLMNAEVVKLERLGDKDVVAANLNCLAVQGANR